MNENQRKEILDLLAKGKINIDEAVQMLSIDNDLGSLAVDEPIHEVDVLVDSQIEIDEDKLSEQNISQEAIDYNPNNDLKVEKHLYGQSNPKWLRIKVSNLESGKDKVSVNIPFGLVEFGLGIANVFSTNDDQINLDQVKDIITSSESGILIEVEDNGSNEQVKIFFD